MVLVRGVKGDIKLHPALKLWGGLAIMLILVIAALVSRVIDFSDDVAQCEARGGTWVGGMIPARVGSMRSIGSNCVELDQHGEEW